MGNQKIAEAYVKTELDAKALMGPFIARLAKVEELKFTDTKVENSVSDISEHVEVYIPTGSIDLAPIINRLGKQKEKLDKEIGKLNGMLNNERFVANAPEEVIAQNKEALSDAQTKQQKIIDQLDSLQG
jgi:valyl-tRNA synthetase